MQYVEFLQQFSKLEIRTEGKPLYLNQEARTIVL